MEVGLERKNVVDRSAVDQWSHEHRVGRIASTNLKRARDLAKCLNEAIRHVGVDDDPTSAGAPLTTRRIRRPGTLHNRLPEIRGRHHHRGIRSAKFEGDDPPGAVEVGFQNATAHRPTASKEHAVDALIRDQCRRDLWATLHQVEDPGGNAGLHRHLGEGLSDARCLFAGLENDRVAREQRRDEVSIGQVSRKVKRSEDRHDPVRLVPTQPRLRLACGDFVIRDPAGGMFAQRDIDLARQRPRFEATLGQDLAHFERDQFGHPRRAGRGDFLPTKEHLDSRGLSHGKPRGLRPTGGRDRGLDVFKSLTGLEGNLIGRRGVPRDDCITRGKRKKLAVDQIGGRAIKKAPFERGAVIRHDAWSPSGPKVSRRDFYRTIRDAAVSESPGSLSRDLR